MSKNKKLIHIKTRLSIKGLSIIGAYLGLIIFTLFSACQLWRLLEIGTAYKAKVLCSGVFVSGMTPRTVLHYEFTPSERKALQWIETSIDHETGSVTADFAGLVRAKAVYREGMGCSLTIGCDESRLRSQVFPIPVKNSGRKRAGLWPEGDETRPCALLPETRLKKLRSVVNRAFMEPGPVPVVKTEAIVVVYRGRIVAERYGKGVSRDTSFQGRGLSGAVLNALAAILVKDGWLRTDRSHLFPEWEGDQRKSITLDNLMRMTSGLEFEEDVNDPGNDLARMLLCTVDSAAYAEKKPLLYSPGSVWHFSSGSMVLISKVLEDTVAGHGENYLAFPWRRLFRPLGMYSAIIELDPSGTFLAGIYGYATARDWARLGLFFMNGGRWNGRSFFPEGWMDYALDPAPCPGCKGYGALFWRTIPFDYTSPSSREVTLPRDTFHAVGKKGEFISIIPSKRLVVVRLGGTCKRHVWDQKRFLADIIDAISP